MNKENIIDYVVHTPHNPNKKVLDDMLETLIEENGSSGGTTFKTFNVQLAENAHLNIVDMGNNLVIVTFTLKDNQTPAKEPLQYTLPTDNAEFTEWIKDKMIVVATPALTTAYGSTGRQGTYLINYLGMLGGAETDLGGAFALSAMFDVSDEGFTDEKLLSLGFTTVTSLGVNLG